MRFLGGVSVSPLGAVWVCSFLCGHEKCRLFRGFFHPHADFDVANIRHYFHTHKYFGNKLSNFRNYRLLAFPQFLNRHA